MKRLLLYLCGVVPLYAMESISKRPSSAAIASSQLVAQMNESLRHCPPFFQLTLDVYSPDTLTTQGAGLIADRIIQYSESTHQPVDRDRMVRVILKLRESYPELTQFLQIWSENKLSSDQQYLEIIDQLPQLVLMASGKRQQGSACCTLL